MWTQLCGRQGRMVLLPQTYTELNCIKQWLTLSDVKYQKGNWLRTRDKPLLGLPTGWAAARIANVPSRPVSVISTLQLHGWVVINPNSQGTAWSSSSARHAGERQSLTLNPLSAVLNIRTQSSQITSYLPMYAWPNPLKPTEPLPSTHFHNRAGPGEVYQHRTSKHFSVAHFFLSR